MTETNKKKFYSELGELILKARKEANLSQDELSKRVNMSRASIVNIEKGRQHPPIHLLWNLSEILKINICKLIPDFQLLDTEIELKNVFKRAIDKTTKKTNINEESLNKFNKFLKKS